MFWVLLRRQQPSLADLWRRAWRHGARARRSRGSRGLGTTAAAGAHQRLAQRTTGEVSCIPVVLRKAMAEVSKIGNYRRGELL